jgi:DNA-binding MarR family transcriptional regulator
MSPSLQEEIRQSKPFDSLEQEALLNIMRTAAVLTHRHEQFFREQGITATQYNVLRIVAGAGSDGISQCDIAERLVTMNADVPRLLKRTEVAGLIERAANPDDKRILKVQLTMRGTEVLHHLAPLIAEYTQNLFPNLTQQQLQTLNELLDASR